MDTFAKLPTAEREVYFVEAGARMGFPPHVIEKDFWVCWTLRRVFALECLKDNVLFKGGTSLSKVHKLIERFSEDIDLSIHRASLGFEGETDPANPELSGKKSRKQNEALKEAAQKKVLEEVLPELQLAILGELGAVGWSLVMDASDPDAQSLSFIYPRTGITLEATAYLPPRVKVEFGARSDHWPAITKTVTPYLSEVIEDAFEQSGVVVKAMDATRTFWEKATILHQMAHLPEAKSFPPRYSRHYCDLANMIRGGVYDIAALDESLLAAVVQHKMTFYRSAWASYETAIRGTFRLIPDERRLSELAMDLISMQEMFFYEPPKIEDVVATLRDWQDTFNQTD
jgi:hypothetical protein